MIFEMMRVQIRILLCFIGLLRKRRSRTQQEIVEKNNTKGIKKSHTDLLTRRELRAHDA